MTTKRKTDMEGIPENEARHLRLLRLLVTALTVVMIVGFIVLIGLLVTRFPDSSQLPLPAAIKLPDGSTPTAITFGSGWYAVVTSENELLVYDQETDTLLQAIPLLYGE